MMRAFYAHLRKELRDQRAIWIAVAGSGIDRYDPSSGLFTHYRHDPNDPTTISDGEYWGDVVEDLQGYIWVGSPRFGLDRLDRQTGRFKHFRNDPDDPTSIASDFVQSLYVDRAGSIWAGHLGAVSRMNPANPGKFVRYAPILPLSDSCTAIVGFHWRELQIDLSRQENSIRLQEAFPGIGQERGDSVVETEIADMIADHQIRWLRQCQLE